MKKNYALLLTLVMLLAFANISPAQDFAEIPIPPNGNNEKAEVSQWIGLVKVTISYHSPNLHGGGGADRSGHIWGEVVHYGFIDEGFGPTKAAPWRAGANETTSISFSHDVKLEGKPIKAGTYGLFLDVEKEGPWQWIFSTNNDGWGSFQYDPKEDVLRVPTTPVAAAHTEFLTYGFDERKPDSTVAFLQWEDKRIPFRIEVPNANEIYVAQIRHNLLSWPGFDYKNWQNAAQFCASNKINLDEALVWADKAIQGPFRGATIGSEDFSTVQTKADVLQAMGKTDEADRLMDKAFQLTGADLLPVHIYGMRLLGAGRNEKAIEVFKLNQKRHPEDKFWSNVGLARAYTASGDKEKAIKNWETVLQNVPESRKAQIPAYEAALKKLKDAS
ncbi:MAG TPA: DUF2911 domain-containing protein [Candidatus Angelobacter sp.]|nr:DUF2911 domain-containing protein [Candidatus Angelobacter sp.]